jgi:hypothetical protein
MALSHVSHLTLSGMSKILLYCTEYKRLTTAPYQRTCHTANFSQLWPKSMPLVGGLYHAADFVQMWPKNVPLVGGLATQRTLTKCGPKICPSLKDFITQWTLTKRGPNVPLIGGLCHTAAFNQMWPKNMPLVEELRHTVDFDQMWPVNVPLIGGLCHAANFDQMRHKNCASRGRGKTVSQCVNGYEQINGILHTNLIQCCGQGFGRCILHSL